MLESRIRELIAENGNELTILNMASDPDYNLATYQEMDGLNDNLIHVIDIQEHLVGGDRSDAILHELVHVYLRELGYDYSNLLGVIQFDDKEALNNQLVNLFDHWILANLIRSNDHSNELFFNILENENRRYNLSDPKNYNDISVSLCMALGLLDLKIQLPVSFSSEDISSSEVRHYYELIYPLKEILVFTNEIDVEDESFKTEYLQVIERFLSELLRVVS